MANETIKGLCTLVVKKESDFSVKLTLNKQYRYLKQYQESIKGFGYTVVNDLDPGNPLRLKEDTFKLYFKEQEINVAKTENAKVPTEKQDTVIPHMLTAKEREERQVEQATKQITTAISGPKPTIASKVSETTEKVGISSNANNLFAGLELLKQNEDVIENIIITPMKGGFISVAVKIKPDLVFSTSGSAEKIMTEFPEMLKGILSLDKKLETLSKIIDERIQIEQDKKVAVQKQSEDEKKKKTIPSKATTSVTKKETPVIEDNQGLFQDQQNVSEDQLENDPEVQDENVNESETITETESEIQEDVSDQGSEESPNEEKTEELWG